MTEIINPEKTQTEAELEEALMQQLAGELGYERITIPNEAALLANLKTQLEKHNQLQFSDIEFARILNHLGKGSVFAKASLLRDRFLLMRDDGTSCYIRFLNQEKWCQNEYQVTNQISIDGMHRNRYDVTLLINGLPLAQIELKRRGLELKEAFNQINRYQKHTYSEGFGLFQYVQIFVISNGVNTKYYANNRTQHFKQTFHWTDEHNHKINNLDAFAAAFLEKCQLSKMICQYVVQHQAHQMMLVMRPYQYYAVEAIIRKVKDGTGKGYIWHTTGSGKTLTSFKAAQIITDHIPKVHKVLFVVDRADLDYQTTQEFNHFSEGSVDGTDDTNTLVKQLADVNVRLIVTTIQKLNNAISKSRYLPQIETLKDKRIVLIFDECHRSQFGETHQRITGFFSRAQLFGFTGTPILKENAYGLKTTKDLFGNALHKYLLPDAIGDDNVLKFSVEYWQKAETPEEQLLHKDKAFLHHPDRIEKIVDWIIQHHSSKTHHKDFSAIMCVSKVELLKQYYDCFKRKKEAGAHQLNIATIFTYAANEDDSDATGLIEDVDFTLSEYSRDTLQSYVQDYNQMYGTSHSVNDSKGFYKYYQDIAKRIKERDKTSFNPKNRVDILLVVNMFLTGFDAKKVNTLYVDKNLKYHGLVQAFSRTNRILDEVKSHGNIVCFRWLKEETDDAIRLFSNKDAETTVLVEPYEHYVQEFNQQVHGLYSIAPTVDAVDALVTDEDKAEFVKAFRELMRLRNVLMSFSDFSWADLSLTAQEFEDYKSKYLDIYHTVKETNNASGGDEAPSIIEDLDFELELIQRDDINVAYILSLLQQLQQDMQEKGKDEYVIQQQIKAILELVTREPSLLSKRELIERFINEHMQLLKKDEDIKAVFNHYWVEEKQKAILQFCHEEELDELQLRKVLSDYLYTNKTPLREEVLALRKTPIPLLHRKNIAQRLTDKIKQLIHTFEDDIGDL